MSNPPEVTVWLDIPGDCRMEAQFTGDGDVQFTFGDWQFGQVVLFELPALSRFVQLTGELLAKPPLVDKQASSAVLKSPVS